MRQAVHIFAKDVRHLWLEILVALAVAGAFTFAVVRGALSWTDSGTMQDVALTLLTYLLPVTWWVLIARLIHAEPLPGDRQFWVTRPYQWKSLLWAKALFIALFVNLPKLVADAITVRAYGFEIGSEVAGLLWTQVLLTAIFVLPVAAFSAVTAGFAQLAMATLLLVLAVAVWSLVIPQVFLAGAPWLGLEWIRSYSAGLVVAVAAVAIILWQYRRRDTGTCRVLAGGATAMALAATACLPWTAGFALQSQLAGRPIDPSTVRIDLNPELKWATRALVDESNVVDLNIALRISEIPAALRPAVDGIVATIEGAAGAVWRADYDPRGQARTEGALTSFHTRVNSSFYRKVKDHPVRIRGSLYLTLYGNPRRTFLRTQEQAVLIPTPGVGLCSVTRKRVGIVLNCRSAFRSRPDLVTLDFVATGRSGQPMSIRTMSYYGPAPFSYSPFPAAPDLIPVTQSMNFWVLSHMVTGVSVDTTEPVAHIRRDFEISGLRLADYEARFTPSPAFSELR
jgi:hypothetical protein